jgi:H+/gluconate symporter-like permease
VGRRRDPTRTTNVELGWLLLVALAVGVLVGLFVGFFVGRIGGNQEEATQPPPPRTVTVEGLSADLMLETPKLRSLLSQYANPSGRVRLLGF